MEPPFPCIHCGEPTAFGSGNFVNRLRADTDFELPDGTTEYRDGYSCAKCQYFDCQRCDKPIYLDEDVTPEMVYGEDHPYAGDLFEDGARFVHEECLTPDEKGIYQKTLEEES